MAGEMAVDILVNGKNPAEMPIQYQPEDEYELSVNEETAAKLNIDMSAFQ